MNEISKLISLVQGADAILIGAGSGMSNAAGMDFWYEASPLFLKHMQYFYDKYHFQGLFQGYYTRFNSPEERWAFLLQSLDIIYHEPPQKPTYQHLKALVSSRPVHVVTTNQDGLFKRFFPEEQVSEIQGSWEFLQSANPDQDKRLYPTKPIVERLLPQIKDHRLPRQDFPTGEDGSALIPWVRGPRFLEDQRYYGEYQKINHFLAAHQGEKLLFLEMGVGRMTPMFIQQPFWELTIYLPSASYVNINPRDAVTSPSIRDRSLLIKDDIDTVLAKAADKLKEGSKR